MCISKYQVIFKGLLKKTGSYLLCSKEATYFKKKKITKSRDILVFFILNFLFTHFHFSSPSRFCGGCYLSLHSPLQWSLIYPGLKTENMDMVRKWHVFVSLHRRERVSGSVVIKVGTNLAHTKVTWGTCEIGYSKTIKSLGVGPRHWYCFSNIPGL